MKPTVFEAKMKQAAHEVMDAKAELEQLASIAKAAVRQITPVRTGNLRDSISARIEGNAFYIGTVVSYAAPVEFGTKHMRAQPYLHPGLEASAPEIEAKLAEWGSKVLEKVGK